MSLPPSPSSGFLEAANDLTPPRSGFDDTERDRYQPGGLLGRGGMGEVRAVYDRRLERVVASKMPRRDDPRAQRRLEQEARMTARLSHPGIVPIYEAGRDEEGRVYYTMPVVTGRTLAEAIAESPDLEARLRLVRALLDASEAVAYAHSRGIIHRDLKPSNILIGKFGDTLVVDWGLAVVAPHRAQGPTGTRGYVSPEQRAGETLDGRTDVYSLGACLYEILSGEPPRTEDLHALLEQRYGDTPPELIAVARRALATDPASRYPDAKALAEDLESWFAGRRVHAYDYSRGELLRRALRPWRVPLAVLCLAILAVAAAFLYGWINTGRQRDRAEQAESEAIAEHLRSEAHLGRALVAQALVAREEGKRARAEVLAAEALMRMESPEARGLLAGLAPLPRPERVRELPAPRCSHIVPDAEATRLACIKRSSVDLHVAGEARPRARLEGSFESITFTHDEAVVLASNHAELFVWDGGTLVPIESEARSVSEGLDAPGAPGLLLHRSFPSQLVDVDGATQRTLLACPGSFSVASDWAGPHVVAIACGDGGIWAHDGHQARLVYRVERDLGMPMEMRTDASRSSRAVVTTSSGRVLVIDLERGSLERTFEIGPRIAIDVAIHGTLIAAATDRGNVLVWDVEADRPLTQLPSSGRPRIRWRESGTILRIVGETITDWRIPTATGSGLFASEAGIAAISISPDDGLLAAAHGDGTLRVWDLRHETIVTEQRWQEGVLKDVRFSPDGSWLATAAAQEAGAQLFDTTSWEREPLPAPSGFRRIAWLDAHRLVGASYTRVLFTWTLDDRGRLLHFDDGISTVFPIRDMEGPVTGGPLALLLMNGDVHAIDGSPVEMLLLERSSGANAAGRLGKHTVIAGPDRLRVMAPGSDAREVEMEQVVPIELDIDPQRQWIAVGTLEGSTLLYDWSTLRVEAILRGHEGRISALQFTHDGRWLLTGSWDGDIRRWDLSLVREDPARLLTALHEAWGMDLESALDP